MGHSVSRLQFYGMTRYLRVVEVTSDFFWRLYADCSVKSRPWSKKRYTLVSTLIFHQSLVPELQQFGVFSIVRVEASSQHSYFWWFAKVKLFIQVLHILMRWQWHKLWQAQWQFCKIWKLARQQPDDETGYTDYKIKSRGNSDCYTWFQDCHWMLAQQNLEDRFKPIWGIKTEQQYSWAQALLLSEMVSVFWLVHLEN